MTRSSATPRFPKTRWIVLILLLPLGGLDLYLLCTTDWGLTFLTLGIILDVIGASVVAIPETPLIDRYTFAGKLRKAKDHLETEWNSGPLCRPGLASFSNDQEKGFYETCETLQSRLKRTNTLTDLDWSDVTRLSVQDRGLRNRSATSSILVRNEEDNDRYWLPLNRINRILPEALGTREWLIISHNGNGELGEESVIWSMIEFSLRQEISDQDGRTVRAGLALLSIGFLHQLIAALNMWITQQVAIQDWLYQYSCLVF